MNKKCPNCRLVGFPAAEKCSRCGADLPAASADLPAASADVAPVRRPNILRRVVICLAVCVTLLLGFCLSLVASANSLGIEQKSTVRSAIRLLRERGFHDDAFWLDNFTIYRRDDNWLNASVAKENAYAATNFPFEIMTLYADFFTYPADDTERAAILLHEARHLRGEGEKEAYEYVWNNRAQLGWTNKAYGDSEVWRNIRHQTREHAPGLFTCADKEFRDCTE